MHIESQIAQLFVNTTRNVNSVERKDAEDCLTQVLRQIKTAIQNNPAEKEKCQEYLDTLYRMIGHTRDIHEGKGERMASYAMLMAFHSVYPVLAQYALYSFVFPSAEEEPPYGSWRDIGPLCEYVKTHSENREDHSLIAVFLEFANCQLGRDTNIWKYAEVSRKAKATQISNVAKWIPRENKKYAWIFDRLYMDWAEEHYPYIMASVISEDSRQKARTKCKQLYRKTLTKLNRCLDTPEIKMCAQQWHNIEPQTVHMNTYIKHSALFTETDSNPNRLDHRAKKQICALNYQLFAPGIAGNPTSATFLPIGYMVRRITTLIEAGSILDDRNQYLPEVKYLNEQWTKMSHHIGSWNRPYILPIVDVSITMWENEETQVYSAIGLAVLIAMRSGLQNRFVAMDKYPKWIAWDETADFATIVSSVMVDIRTMQKTSANIQNTFEWIASALTNANSTARFRENTTIILLSDCRKDILKENRREKYVPLPIVYWNTGSYVNSDMINSLDPTNRYVSGQTTAVLKRVLSVITNNRTESQYECVRTQLGASRYDRLSRYLAALHRPE
jgi:hypothetical protein